MTRETQLDELLLKWEEGRQQGNSVAPEELCADCPDLVQELEKRIGALVALGPVLDGTPTPSTVTVDDQTTEPEPKGLPIIPGYEVLSELTPGGMGVVYKVRNLKVNGRIEALKMIRPKLAPNRHLVQRFQVEIQAHAQFEDERIVRVYATGEHAGRPFFTMEFVKGGSLAHNLARFQADQRLAVKMLAKVARAVHFLHQNDIKKIIHRDLKPANILLKQDEPLVSDFGLAKFFDREEENGPVPENSDSQLTQAGAVMGTTCYMSPEQAAAKTTELTPASDTWALGVILYELLTGRRPFLGKDDASIRKAILSTEPAKPRDLNPKVNKQLDAICLKCLEKAPVARYPSAAALADALERWTPPGLWQKIRRRPTLSATICLGIIFASLVIGITLAIKPEQVDPDLVGKSLLATVHAGEKVFFIGPNGDPVRKHWILPGSQEPPTPEGCFTIQTRLTGLLELLPGPLPTHFQFGGKVREISGDGSVGLYAGYSSQSTDKGVTHSFITFAFSDRSVPQNVKSVPPGCVRLNLANCFEPNLNDRQYNPVLTGILRRYMPKKPWHDLEMDISPERIRVRFDGEYLKELTSQDKNSLAMNAFSAAKRSPLASPAPFNPSTGVGLFLNQASGAFHSVYLEPK